MIILKGNLAGYTILGWQLFSLSLEDIIPLSCAVDDAKMSSVNLTLCILSIIVFGFF